MVARIAFLGSPAFAVPILAALTGDERFEIALVVTQPDRPSGRGRRLASPPVKSAADDLGLPTFQPQSLRDEDAVDRLRAVSPDLLVVVAYGELLRRSVLEIAPHGAINVHPSLLPRYRGAAPIPAAILAGDPVTGTSIIRLVRRLDAGPLISQSELVIKPDDTAETLSARLANQAAEMLPSACLDWIEGRIHPDEQDESLASYTREWTRHDALIDWAQPASAIERLVRAAIPWPIAWTTIDGVSLAIHQSRSAPEPDDELAPGILRQHADHVFVGTGAGQLRLVTVQPSGKRPMAAAEWLRGLRRPDPVLGT